MALLVKHQVKTKLGKTIETIAKQEQKCWCLQRINLYLRQLRGLYINWTKVGNSNYSDSYGIHRKVFENNELNGFFSKMIS